MAAIREKILNIKQKAELGVSSGSDVDGGESEDDDEEEESGEEESSEDGDDDDEEAQAIRQQLRLFKRTMGLPVEWEEEEEEEDEDDVAGEKETANDWVEEAGKGMCEDWVSCWFVDIGGEGEGLGEAAAIGSECTWAGAEEEWEAGSEGIYVYSLYLL